jgi:hypothetical protein
MTQMDPPVSNRELLGKVVSVERNGTFVVPSREIRAGNRSVAALVRRSAAAARIAVAMHEMFDRI